MCTRKDIPKIRPFPVLPNMDDSCRPLRVSDYIKNESSSSKGWKGDEGADEHTSESSCSHESSSSLESSSDESSSYESSSLFESSSSNESSNCEEE
ncbi:hypothetical protein [Peribacillus kribbensis]|uniref:hypothetical protein n=1 Tax=Peribacillus kribbensis TaxID=356658 RepID=UPI00047C4A20|nr:hypothetical protein [Peribacillus kribbensis]